MLQISQHNKGKLVAGLQRYAFHIPFLRKVLGTQGVFRPHLRVQQELAHVRFELEDVTCAPGARCVAMLGRGASQVLATAEVGGGRISKDGGEGGKPGLGEVK
jgi:hypothetical protein